MLEEGEGVCADQTRQGNRAMPIFDHVDQVLVKIANRGALGKVNGVVRFEHIGEAMAAARNRITRSPSEIQTAYELPLGRAVRGVEAATMFCGGPVAVEAQRRGRPRGRHSVEGALGLEKKTIAHMTAKGVAALVRGSSGRIGEAPAEDVDLRIKRAAGNRNWVTTGTNWIKR